MRYYKNMGEVMGKVLSKVESVCPTCLKKVMGQKVEYEGSLVILGDVNDGAEVIAGENIIVLGILRGLAHAGAKGNREAIIAASSIEAPQLRIANIIKEREREEILEDARRTYAYINSETKMIIE